MESEDKVLVLVFFCMTVIVLAAGLLFMSAPPPAWDCVMKDNNAAQYCEVGDAWVIFYGEDWQAGNK